MAIRLAERFLSLLQKYNLITTPDPGILNELENPYWLLPLVEKLIPERWVGFGESIHSVASYQRVIERLADTTQGEWSPSALEVQADVTNENRIIIRFMSDDEQFVWTFEHNQYEQSISPAFYSQLDNYCTENLRGEFVRVPVPDPADEFIYLPQPIAIEYRETVMVLSSDELVELVGRYLTHSMFNQRMLLEFVAQFDLRNINQPSQRGELPLSIATQKAIVGTEGASDLVSWLIEKGGDPMLKDGDGKSASALSQGSRKITRILEQRFT
jgi:hypothetical protein